jgi:hypothetical protein
MTNPTSNFGWQMPTSTDLVTDLPADFAVFGQAVDTTMADLKGGTTGQILSKATATDMDFTWITNDVGDITAVTAGTGISGGGTSGAVTVTNSMATAITTAGDVIYGTGSGTFSRLGIGTASQVLKVNSGATAPEWGSASSGLNYVTGATFTGVTSFSLPTDTFTSTYKNYRLLINFTSSSADAAVIMRMRASGTDVTSGGYFYDGAKATGGTTVTAVTGGADTSWGLGLTAYIERAALAFDILNPKGGTSNDRILGNLFTSTMKGGFIGYWENGAAGSGYDSLSFIKASGTFGGYYRVYGYGDS